MVPEVRRLRSVDVKLASLEGFLECAAEEQLLVGRLGFFAAGCSQYKF